MTGNSLMARKWSNDNLPGALHFVTGNFLDRTPVFTEVACCNAFLDELGILNREWPSKPKQIKFYEAPHSLNAEARRDRLHFLIEQLNLRPVPDAVIATIPKLYQPPSPN